MSKSLDGDNILPKNVDGTPLATGGGGGSGDNIYNTDGTLDSNRTVSGGSSQFKLNLSAPFQYTGSPVTDQYFLQSDASGNASWQPVTASANVSLSDGSLITPSLRFTNDSDTGISRNASGAIVFGGNAIPTGVFTPSAFLVNNTVNTKNVILSDVTFNPTTPLGSILVAWTFTAPNIRTATVNTALDFDNAQNIALGGAVDGRPSVAVSTSGNLNIYGPGSAKINTFAAQDNLSVAFWFRPTETGILRNFFEIGVSGSPTNRILLSRTAADKLKIFFHAGITLLVNFEIDTVLPQNTWSHIVLNTGTAGLNVYVNAVKEYEDLGITQSMTSFTAFNTFAFSNIVGALDDIVVTTNEITQALATGLFTDSYSLSGIPTFEQVSKLTFDTGDQKTKLQLADNTDIVTFDATNVTIPHPLRYTGSTPTNGHVLTCDADGDATWAAPSGAPSVTYFQNRYWVITTNQVLTADICAINVVTNTLGLKIQLPKIDLNKRQKIIVSNSGDSSQFFDLTLHPDDIGFLFNLIVWGVGGFPDLTIGPNQGVVLVPTGPEADRAWEAIAQNLGA